MPTSGAVIFVILSVHSPPITRVMCMLSGIQLLAGVPWMVFRYYINWYCFGCGIPDFS